MALGVHISIAGGISKAVERATLLGCDAFQCFGGNPRAWKQKPLNSRDALDFRHLRADSGIGYVAVHASYLINLSSPDDELFARSIELLTVEINRADKIGADHLVLHLGSAKGQGIDFAIKRATEGLVAAYRVAHPEEVELLLENTAGAGTTTGSNLSDIGTILDSLEAHNIKAGFCFDTCHGHAAGYPMKTAKDGEILVETIESEAGLDRLKLIHLNDSKGEAGGNLDRHEHIGKGNIGPAALKAFLNNKGIKGLPVILETPKTDEKSDPKNLKKVRGLLNIL